MPRLSDVSALSLPSDRGKLQLDLAYQIMLASRRWKARFTDLMKEEHQTDSRWSTLYFLADAPKGLTQSELAERLGIQGPTLVRLLDALERQGLVSRRALIGDRRAKLVFLEDEGRAVLTQIDQLAARLRDEVFSDFSDRDLLAASRMMERLCLRLDKAQESHLRDRTRSA